MLRFGHGKRAPLPGEALMTPFGMIFVSALIMALGAGGLVGVEIAYHDPQALPAFIGGMLFATPWALTIGRMMLREELKRKGETA